jgi:hypothetical protein
VALTIETLSSQRFNSFCHWTGVVISGVAVGVRVGSCVGVAVAVAVAVGVGVSVGGRGVAVSVGDGMAVEVGARVGVGNEAHALLPNNIPTKIAIIITMMNVLLVILGTPSKIHLSTKVTKEHEEKTFVNLRVLRGYFSSVIAGACAHQQLLFDSCLRPVRSCRPDRSLRST